MGLTKEAASGGRHRRRRSAAGAITMIIALTVLSVLGIGYVRFAGHEQTASPRPDRPGATAGDSPFTAEAAAAVARLQTKVGDAYTATHLWQAASALSATIGFMDATGSRAYLSDLSATYQAVWAHDRRGSSFGLDWAGPYLAPTITAQASALDILTTQIPGPGPAHQPPIADQPHPSPASAGPP